MATEKFDRTWPLTENGDYDLDENRDIYYLDGSSGVEQELRVLLATREGEHPFYPEFGVPVFDIAGAPEAVVERELREALLWDDRVASVPTIDIQREPGTRDADVRIVVELVDGEPIELTTRVPYRGDQQ